MTTGRPSIGAFLLFEQSARGVRAESLWDYEATFILQPLFGNVCRTPSFASVKYELVGNYSTAPSRKGAALPCASREGSRGRKRSQ